MTELVAWLNAIVSLASGALSLTAAARPGLVSRSTSVSDGEHFYARMCALRAVPIGLLAAYAPFAGGTLALSALACACTIQAADAVYGGIRRQIVMIVGPSAAALTHVAMVGVLLR